MSHRPPFGSSTFVASEDRECLVVYCHHEAITRADPGADMDSVGLIDLERLRWIPRKHWKAHEFCFFLHDSLARLLVEYEASDAHNAVVNAFRQAVAGREQEFQDFDL